MIGRFPFVGPWWKVSVKVKHVGSKYHMQGYPSYFLQTDAGENQENVLSLFFKECEVPDNFREQFFQWFKTNPSGISLNFIHLKETLKIFQTSGQKSVNTNNFDIYRYIQNSCKYKYVVFMHGYGLTHKIKFISIEIRFAH